MVLLRATVIAAAKVISLLIVGLSLAACQTTGLKPGSLTSTFNPDGWHTKHKGNATYYFCPRTKCSKPQSIIVAPAKIKGQFEAAIKNDIISKDLVEAIGKSISIASKGRIKSSKLRKIVNKNYSGFEQLETVTIGTKKLYFQSRSIVQNNRGTIIISVATSPATAQRNLNRFMASTQIKRL